MEKMKMHSYSRVDANVSKMETLFPNCVTEIVNDNGELERVIDFDALKEEFSTHVVEGKRERYQFTWPDKNKAKALLNQNVTSTLRPCRAESVDFDNTKNLYIEGDNLEVLKLLQETYLGKIKMIYIDPPYNTGNDFLYNDTFSVNQKDFNTYSGDFDSEGNRLVKNLDSNGRFHTDWLNMIYPRLRLSRDLLTDDGVLFISIDDHEQDNLRKICDEIFGQSNYVATLAVQVNPRGRHLDKFVAKTHEAIIVYVKNSNNQNSISGIEKEGRMLDEYNKEDKLGKYRLLGLRNRNQAFNPVTRPNLYYPLYVCPATKEVSVNKDERFTDEVFPDTSDGVKTCWTWMKSKVVSDNKLLTAELSGNEWRIFRKDYMLSADGTIATTLVKSIWDEKEVNNDYGKKAIKDLFGANVMSFPKSPYLLEKLIQIGSHDDSLILDFFSGSATTAHAVFNVNKKDNGHRRFIMIQIPESCEESSEAYKLGYNNICKLGEQRIRLAGKMITDNSLFDGIDVGFRVLKLDSSNMNDIYYKPSEYSQDMLAQMESNIKSDRTPEDLLFQVMLDLGVELSSKIDSFTIKGKEVFNVAEGWVMACFDEDVSEDVIIEIAKQKPRYFVMRDSSMAHDTVAVNFDEIFNRFSPETIRKVL